MFLFGAFVIYKKLLNAYFNQLARYTDVQEGAYPVDIKPKVENDKEIKASESVKREVICI